MLASDLLLRPENGLHPVAFRPARGLRWPILSGHETLILGSFIVLVLVAAILRAIGHRAPERPDPA